MEIIDCKSIAQKWKDGVKAQGSQAGLCVIQVGNDPASDAYVRGKKRDCEEIGFHFEHVRLSPRNLDYQLKSAVFNTMTSHHIDGVIIQLPLPEEAKVTLRLEKLIPPSMDVDGFNPQSYFKPCTPEAVMELLKEINVDPTGKHVVIAGRSDIVGKPLAKMMNETGATVTVCHSKTPVELLNKLASEADIFVSAVGKVGLVASDVFKDGAVVIDVGINRTEEGLKGDVKIVDGTRDIRITPVPGGVGLLTRAMLMRHVNEATEY